jgi:very-short-patch-repair endonuclease
MHSYNPRSPKILIKKKEYTPHYIVELSRQMRLDMTKAETLLWEKLCKRRFDGLRFRRQHPIHRYIVDFYCHEKKLVIEADGLVHEKQKAYDQQRDDDLRVRGYHVLRFLNESIENDITSVLNRMRNFLASLLL